MKKNYSQAIESLLLLLLIFIAPLTSNAQYTPIPDSPRPGDGKGCLDNGTVKVCVNLNAGAAITYFSKSNSSSNLVNNSDKGRQLQFSYYNGPGDFAQSSTNPQWRELGWNPIEAGDHTGASPNVSNYGNNGTTIYTKVQPLFWPLQQQLADVYFEKWVTLDGNAVRVHIKTTMARSDTRFFGSKPQELPCYYGIADYYQHVYYSGDQPFTGAATTTLLSGATQGEHCSENWMGIKNPNTGQVVGLWAKDIYEFVRWKIGGNAGGEFSGDATYVTALPYIIMDHNKIYESDAALITGTESEVRNWVTAQPRPATLPDFQFNNSRERWTYYGNVSDPGEPNGELNATISNESNWILNSPQVFYKASELPKIYLKAKITGNITDIHFAWNRYGESSGDVVQANQYFNFAVNNDGQSHVYEINASNHPNWTGGIKGLKFFHGANSPQFSTGNIKVESVTYNDPGGSNPCDFNVSASATNSTPSAGAPITLNSTCSAASCSGVSYSWSGNGISGSGSSISFNAPSAAGTYTYTVTAAKSGCTSKTANVSVSVISSGGSTCINLGDQCSGNQFEIRSYSLSLSTGGTIPLTIKYRAHERPSILRMRINNGSWQNFNVGQTNYSGQTFDYVNYNLGSFALNNGNNSFDFATADGLICYRELCAGSGGGCTTPSAPSLSASPSIIAPGSSSTLTANGCSGGVITWSNGLGTGVSKTVSPAATTTYTAACSISGCTSSNASITVTVTGGSVNCNTLEGHFDVANCDFMYGWVYDISHPNDVVSVDLYEGSTLLAANILANNFRQDLQDAGKGNGVHGFQLPTPSSLKNGQLHSLTLKVSGCSNYSLINSPKTINGCSGGSLVLNPSDPQPPGRMESLLAFPNPNSGNFDASFYLGVGKKATLTVTDMVGKQLYRRQLTGQGMHREKVNLPVKVAGILLLQLVKEDKTLTHKIKLTR